MGDNNTSLVFYGYAENRDNESLVHQYKLVVDVVANTVVVPRSLTTIYTETDKSKPTILQVHEEYNRVAFFDYGTASAENNNNNNNNFYQKETIEQYKERVAEWGGANSGGNGGGSSRSGRGRQQIRGVAPVRELLAAAVAADPDLDKLIIRDSPKTDHKNSREIHGIDGSVIMYEAFFAHNY